MTIQGLRHTANFITNQRPENWREGILLLEPNGKAPLFALSSLMKSKSTDDPTYHWFEKVMSSRRAPLSVDPGVGATLTAVAVGGVNRFLVEGIVAGMILRAEQTGELMRVTADPVTGLTTLTVQRGLGNVPATAFNPAAAGINPHVHVVGVSLAENSTPPTAAQFDPNEKFNYTQIFRDTLSISRTAKNTRLRTGDAVKEAKRETLQMHSAGIEWAMIFGERGTFTGANGEPGRYMDGVIRQISRNVAGNVIANAGANTTFTILENWMEQSMRYGSQEKLVLCGNQFLLEIQRICRLSTNTTFNMHQGQKEFGMDVSRLITPFGTWVLKSHPLFNQMTSGITAGTPYRAVSSWGLVLDMDRLTYRYLVEGDTQYQPVLQQNGLDGMQSGYLTECGIQLHNPETHMVIQQIGPATAG